ncbi:hypothetical protein C3731_15695 [Brucella oryzae]|uniref:Uncharacterized protein n=1 Tax=Brucella oryzae TaxID=335286 RepID=A0A2S7IX44_9HYPH|nr:hypothetical protein C3731_15695 [Brucella oryzae]
MFTAFRQERNRCGGAAVAANGRIMREGETADHPPLCKGARSREQALMHFQKRRKWRDLPEMLSGAPI